MSTTVSTLSNPDGITGKLCTWIHETRLSDIPREVIDRAKYLILDGIACALVAAHLPWSETAAKGIFKMEPTGTCTIIGWQDKKLSPLAAAILNSTFIQGFELDDYHSLAPLHSNSLLLPALFAAAESEVGTVFSGADLLRAYVVGCEVGPRVGLALHGADLLSRGWHSGAVQGPSASAAAVSSFLGLKPAQIESALGIACTQAGGLMSAQFGSMAKRMQHGFGSRNGLFAALMAREGYTGIQEVYETPYGGFLSCFSQGASFSPPSLPGELASGLSERWEIHGIRVKLHASMATLHAPIDCVANLQAAHPDRFTENNLGNIEKITVEQAKAAFEHGGWIAPPDKAMTSTAAQMSVQYACAAQLLDREVLMSQFGAKRLNRPEIRALMAKVQPQHNPSFDGDGASKSTWTTIVTVHFRDSDEVLQERVEAAKGLSPPASNNDIVEKWRSLTRGVISEQRRDEIERTVLGLENLKDVKKLVGMLSDWVECPIDV